MVVTGAGAAAFTASGSFLVVVSILADRSSVLWMTPLESFFSLPPYNRSFSDCFCWACADAAANRKEIRIRCFIPTIDFRYGKVGSNFVSAFIIRSTVHGRPLTVDCGPQTYLQVSIFAGWTRVRLS